MDHSIKSIQKSDGYSPTKTVRSSTLRKSKRPKEVLAEDNWELVGNPTKYLDVLPQPYRFINECLTEQIILPVFDQITKIEERKKTPEYEGNVREVQATGQMDLNGVTTMSRLSEVVLAGGISEKQGSAQRELSHALQSKSILGDKFGHIHLLDVSRKIVLDKKDFPRYEGRRIVSIATACLEWVDTRLIYAAVVARASPIVSIVVFKNNENKFRHLYSINMLPEVENADALEENEGQSYDLLPACVSLSLDCEFLSVTTYNGTVKIIKMPPVLDPIQNEPIIENADDGVTPGASSQGLAQDAGVVIKAEIENIEHQDLDLAANLIASIPPKSVEKFEDPYKYNPDDGLDEDEAPVADQSMEKTDTVFSYTLGKHRVKDSEGGDAGSMLKQSKFFPYVSFLRSQYCGKQISSILHSEVGAPSGNSKQMKQYLVTSGIVIAYMNTFSVQIYNLQNPSKESVPQDYSNDFYSKILMQRKLSSKKKNEKNLSQLVKLIQTNDGVVPPDDAPGKSQQELKEIQISKQKEQVEARIAQMRTTVEKQIETGEASREFTMPYQISAAMFQTFEDDFQNLAVGLIDGALIIIDLILGLEKHFLEKHPAKVTTIAFFEDKAILSGSVDGRVNLSDLENLNNKKKQNKLRFLKCQNLMDRKVPVAKVETSNDMAIGMALDIEGNCRFYDLIRFRKMAKISSNQQRLDDVKLPSKFSILQGNNLTMTADAFLVVNSVPKIFWEESQQVFFEKPQAAIPDPKDAKKKDAAPVEENEEPPEPIPHFQESSILVEKMYSDDADKIKCVPDIIFDLGEHVFYVQKSNLSIFRFEDVLFTVFPHLASLKRKFNTSKEIFVKNDPFQQKSQHNIGSAQQEQSNAQGGLMGSEGSYKSNMHEQNFMGIPGYDAQSNSSHVMGLADSKQNLNKSHANNMGNSQQRGSMLTGANETGFSNAKDAASKQQSYDIPTIKLLNPELYQEMEKKERQMKDPIFQSLKNIKERHTYLENRQQRIDKRNTEIARELKDKNDERLRQQKLAMLGKAQ